MRIALLGMIILIIAVIAGAGLLGYELAGSSNFTTRSSGSVSTPTSFASSYSSPLYSGVTSTGFTSESSALYSTSISSGNTTSYAGNYTDWLTYHRDLSRSGYLASATSNFDTATSLWNSSSLDGDIYAEPLIANGVVFAATENNSVYALNETSGDVIWKTSLGLPIPLSSLQCGDIDPNGITGTPAIDLKTGTIYAAAFVQPGEHILYALNLNHGNILWNRSIDQPGMNVMVQQQRAALAVAGGYVYVAFGGFAGDCGNYQGWVVGMPENNSGSIFSYTVPTSAGGGIWAPSGISYDNTSNRLYVTTGNSAGSSSFDFGESVIALSLSLHEEDFFAPTNWASLNSQDTDLGSMAPLILGNDTIFQVGKEGIGFLLSSNHLGGLGGQIFSDQVCDAGEGAFGGAAYNFPYIFVPCRGGLVCLRVFLNSGTTNSTFARIWRASEGFSGPPIIAEGVVWNLDVGSGTLFGYDQTNGSILFSHHVGNLVHFATPSASRNLIFATSGNEVESFSCNYK